MSDDLLPLPAQETLKSLLSYNPFTGALTWRPRPLGAFSTAKYPLREHARWNSRYAGVSAFISPSGNGHLRGKIGRTSYSAHRIIWKLVYGVDPGPEIDHFDRDKTNNRLTNLRSGTKTDNLKNRAAPANNTSGAVGVSQTSNGRWQAYISEDGVRVHLGTFGSFDLAVGCRIEAAKRLGYNIEGHIHG